MVKSPTPDISLRVKSKEALLESPVDTSRFMQTRKEKMSEGEGIRKKEDSGERCD